MRYQTAGPGQNRPASLSADGEWLDYPSGYWLKDWLANQGEYVRLACGHTEDLKDRGATIVGKRVLCDECGWTSIKRSISFGEYIGLRREPTPDDPPF